MKYLSEILPNLPTNCLFDKGKVGCGGTTLALTNDKPYVVAVPFQSLVDNKIAQDKNHNLLGVQAGVGVMDIKYYLQDCNNNNKVPKIITTYDSLPKVMHCINPKEFYLLVDEYHILLTQYAFRSEAIKTVLNCYAQFKEFCFMTATPIEDEFVLDELKNIPVVHQDWDDVLQTKVISQKCDSVIASICKVVKSHLNNTLEGNAYIFVNSVDFIKNIIQKCDLNDNNCRVICSQQNKTQLSVKKGKTTDTPKKINLLTSTAFEGCDIYDEEGVTYVVSTPQFEHTLCDISTSMQQIAGRIRNSKYIGTIYHLYTTCRYNQMSYDEFRQNQEQTSLAEVNSATEFNQMSAETRARFTPNGYYTIIDENGYAVVDTNLIKVDTFNYKVFNNYQIRVNLNQAYIDNAFSIVEQQQHTKLKDLDLNTPFTETFKDIILKVKKIDDEVKIGGLREQMKNEIYATYKRKYPFLQEAIDKLGYKQINTLHYNQQQIKQELLKVDNNGFDVKIVKSLKLKTGDFISKADLKNKLNSIYNTLKVAEKPSASDIVKWYDVKETSIRVNGKQIKGYTIVRPKLNLNKKIILFTTPITVK